MHNILLTNNIYLSWMCLQLGHVDLVHLEQQSMMEMFLLHLISIKEVLVVVPAIR